LASEVGDDQEEKKKEGRFSLIILEIWEKKEKKPF